MGDAFYLGYARFKVSMVTETREKKKTSGRELDVNDLKAQERHLRWRYRFGIQGLSWWFSS